MRGGELRLNLDDRDFAGSGHFRCRTNFANELCLLANKMVGINNCKNSPGVPLFENCRRETETSGGVAESRLGNYIFCWNHGSLFFNYF